MKNHGNFTYSYSQPGEYHFCLDSVIFPQLISQRLRGRIQNNTQILDLCSGCGVIGFELAYHLPEIENLDFLEIQSVFRPHFEENLKITGHDHGKFRFLEGNYSSLLERPGSYDFILANPPYFFAVDGKTSPSEINNRCRFFLDADMETLIRASLHALKPGGEAFLLIKSGRRHGRDTMADIRRWTGAAASIEIAGDIRGTSAVHFRKPV